eukprot:COSAG01_NODE_22912_length_836_cov_1.024423_2_plen_83_part_00
MERLDVELPSLDRHCLATPPIEHEGASAVQPFEEAVLGDREGVPPRALVGQGPGHHRGVVAIELHRLHVCVCVCEYITFAWT